MRNKGFTLIELLVVILIIGLLLTLIIPNFVLFRERARASSVKKNMYALQQALEGYATEHCGRFPREEQADWSDEENIIWCYFPGGDPIGIEGEPRYGVPPTNPYTGHRYNDPEAEVENDMDYQGYFGVLELGQHAIKDGAGTDLLNCPYLGLEPVSGASGSIEVLTYVNLEGVVEEYGICGFGQDITQPICTFKPHGDSTSDNLLFFVLHN